MDGESYSVISREADMLGDDFKDEKKFRLDRIIPGEKFKFVYEYDFGDSIGSLLVRNCLSLI